jgi:transposase-like protein
LDEDRWVYLWAEGIYSGLRAEGQRLCTLVGIGVNDRGEKRFLAIEDGVRELTQSWREVLLGLKAPGASRSWPSATAPWASGRHWSKYSRSRGINAAGCI